MFQEKLTAQLTPCLASICRDFVSSTKCQEVSSANFSTAFSSPLHSDLEACCLSFMYQGFAASTRRTYMYSSAQQKFINFCDMIRHVNSSSSPCPLNGPCVFLPRSWLIPRGTLLLRCIYLRYGLFMWIKDSPTHWRTAFGFKELSEESSVHRALFLLIHVFQFLVTFFP